MKEIVHGFGVMEFNDVIEVDQDFLSGWIERRKAQQPDDYILQDDGTYLNRGGYRFTAEEVEMSPGRLLRLDHEVNDEDLKFFHTMYEGMGECVRRYISHFPEVGPCIWWRTQPHVATYGVTAGMGFHHDNLIGDGEASETSLMTVLTGSLILRDTCEGGNLQFKYPNLDFKPKTGSAFIYSAGYLGTHAVTDITSGHRVSYLEFFGQGNQPGADPFQ